MGALEAMARPSFTVPVVEEMPAIDGRLDDPAWKAAVRLGDFGQVEPESGTAPTEETEVWIVRTESALYIGAKCFDRDPTAILARDRRRDTTGAGDDRFRIVLDPFGRGARGLLLRGSQQGVPSAREHFEKAIRPR